MTVPVSPTPATSQRGPAAAPQGRQVRTPSETSALSTAAPQTSAPPDPAAGGLPLEVLTCAVCGTPAVPGARFCYACGSALGPAVDPVPAERRRVTVLFGDLSDFTAWAEDLDPERVGVVTDRVLAALARVVATYGGHVDKLTGDGIMAVFGAPTAHEDDAERAVRAAWAMQGAVRRLVADEAGGRQLSLRVGLNTGEVLAGVQAALSYTVVGDTVNTAARLCNIAPVGSVLAGRGTAAETEAIAVWRPLEPVRLKGKREPVPAYELASVHPAGGGRPGSAEEVPFVGRADERDRLLQLLREVVETGEPSSVLVVGDAGVGKTRLALEVTRAAEALPGARVLWGRCTPYGVTRDLAPLIEIVSTALGLSAGTYDADTRETAADRVRRGLARLRHPSAALPLPASVADGLLALLGLAADESLLPRDAVAPGAAPAGDPVLAAVATLLTVLADDGPLLLVVDDLQWASRALVEALLAVTSAVHGPVLLIGVGRPESLSLRSGWPRELPRGVVLDLGPLDDATSETLLRAYLGGAPVEPRVRDLLLRRSAGNPFFLSELLHLLVERGLLVQRDGPTALWTITGELPSGLDTALPAGVQAVLAARIDDLDPASKAVLRDAAVIGTRFPMAALSALGAAAGHGTAAQVDRAVATLVDRGLLRRTETEGLDDVAEAVFGHALVRDVAYAGIPKAERARRHAAVAGWAARAGVLRAGEVDALVAAQAQRAVALAKEMRLPPGDPAWSVRDVGVAALMRLGAAALSRDDNVGAERVLARAVRLVEAPTPLPPPPPVTVAAARAAHARALARIYRLDEARERLEGALDSEDPGVRAQSLVVLGEVHRKRGRDADATRAYVSALAAASEAGLDRITGDALRQLGLVDYGHGRLRSAEERFGHAYTLAERVGDQRGAGWALRHLAWTATTRGDYSTAEVTLGRARELFAAISDDDGLAWCVATEGFIRLLQGRFTAARAACAPLLGGEEVSSFLRWGVLAAETIDAIAAAELGSITVARARAGLACAGFEELHDAWGQVLALVAAGIAARGAGDLDAALELLTRAVHTADVARHPLPGSLALVVTGYCHLEREDLDAAEEVAGRAVAAVEGLDLEPHAVVGAQVLLALVRRGRGDLDGALALLEQASAALAQPSLLFPRRQALAHLAGTLLSAGRPDEALAVALRAQSVPAEDIRSRVIGLRTLGAALDATGDRAGAKSALASALELARSTEQRTQQAATERALAALESAPVP